MKRRIGVYPGTFDPITNGHSDIIRRALNVVDHLVIGVARNDAKGPLFSTDERVEIVRDEMSHLENGDPERIEVKAFDTLLMHFAESVGAGVILHHDAESRVVGLTTAASIWVAAALGTACGAGFWIIAVLALAFTLAVLTLGGPIERAWGRLLGTSKDDGPASPGA